ncbi:helix-turn-helix domain-containing protein [Geomicrobium sp. JCM 19055]|uniref:helix-turn-helix domain-containing protein n=1 Tax=Geomicrobium sp. JCM 19055 TaxID=1460649 RepID=UPI00187CB133|nr:helix-turn-helix domain-containing protein [Geomicrobium sp. JCM 19055]
MKSSIERGMNVVEGSRLAQEDLGRYDDVHLEHTAQKERFHGTLEEAMNRYEKTIIEKAVLEVEGDRTKAAALLGIHLSSLYRKLSKYQI